MDRTIGYQREAACTLTALVALSASCAYFTILNTAAPAPHAGPYATQVMGTLESGGSLLQDRNAL